MAYTDKEIQCTKDRLGDLRAETPGLTRKLLSQEIERTQGYSIAPSSLGEFESDESERKFNRTRNMSLACFVAIADYYKVPLEYLLGRSNIRDPKNVPISVQMGLDDKALHNLELLKDIDDKHKDDYCYHSRTAVLSTLLAQPEFLKMLDYIATGCQYLDKQSHFHEQTFWDESGDYSDDKHLIEELNQRDSHLLDADYQTTAQLYFSYAKDSLTVLLHDILEGTHLPKSKPTLSHSVDELIKGIADPDPVSEFVNGILNSDDDSSGEN